MHLIGIEKTRCWLTRQRHNILLKWHLIDHSHPFVGEVDCISIWHVVSWNLFMHIEILAYVLLLVRSLLLLPERVLRLGMWLWGKRPSLMGSVCAKAFLIILTNTFFEQACHVCIGSISWLRINDNACSHLLCMEVSHCVHWSHLCRLIPRIKDDLWLPWFLLGFIYDLCVYCWTCAMSLASLVLQRWYFARTCHWVDFCLVIHK